jgi:hypothetical protein
MYGILAAGLVLVIAAYLGFVLAFVDPIPGELWLGFAIVVVVAVTLAGVAAALVFGSDRPAVGGFPARPAPSNDGVLHLLVVADEMIGADPLRREVCDRAGGCTSEVLVVAPALNTPVRHWTDDEDRARVEARARLAEELATLARLGIAARGEVGSDDPLQAIADALRTFPADEIVISTHPRERANWLEEDVVERARRTFGVPVVHVAG